ncbi:type II methionyl aminopeptidase [archaeon]|nr:type II methionyl aminopeptidase [archaeon]
MEEEQLQKYVEAGKIAKKVVDYARGFIKKDMLLIDIANKIDEKIFELGAEPAFPVNLSINEIAAHYTPGTSDETKAEGLLKVDIGVDIEGFIADTAFSLDLTEDGRFKEMIKENERILEVALSELKIGSKVSVIGKAITKELENSEYRVIKNLSGHSLDEYEVHAGLTISNYENENSFELKDIAIAIEPFLTKGKGEIYEGKLSEIYVLQKEGRPRDRESRAVLEFIQENFSTKPFCKRWLEEEKFHMLNFALRTLVKEGILHNFPVLIEESKQPVSQAEHTVIFKDKIYITTK